MRNRIERIEQAIGSVMSDAGYQRLGPLVYKARWGSPEVEHFVYFVESGKRKGVFGGNFGIRNPAAERFSVDAIRAYSGEFHFQALRYDESASCTMRFRFDLFTFGWLIVSTQSENEIGGRVKAFISEHLRPSIGSITSIDDFLTFLVSDAAPFRWAITNGAIRAAQVISLAGQSGVSVDWTRSALENRLQFIAHGFPIS